jgi:hypothetical protein
MSATGMRTIAIAALVVGLGCRPAAPTTDEPTESAAPLPPTRAPAGEVLDATIPLYSGGSLALAELRGRAVVLEITASYVPAWARTPAVWRDLVARHPDLAVVTVALDLEQTALRSWETDPPPFVLGWDPQGALAARLQAAKLPTVVVLDRDGRLVHQEAAFDPDHADRVVAAVAQAAGGSR